MTSQNISNVYLCHLAPKVDLIRLRLVQKLNKHTRIKPRKRHLAHTFEIERPELRSAIRHHVMHLQPSFARQYGPSTVAIRIRASGVPTHVCAA